jgi:hypothetical protein
VPTYITQTGDCYCQKEDFNISSGVYSFCWRDFRQSIFSQLVSSSLLYNTLKAVLYYSVFLFILVLPDAISKTLNKTYTEKKSVVFYFVYIFFWLVESSGFTSLMQHQILVALLRKRLFKLKYCAIATDLL